MTNLRDLRFGANSITELPSKISNLARLETLEIRANKIKTLPPEIGKLVTHHWTEVDLAGSGGNLPVVT
jgi:Leucine-rich repeat (LRR) protein